MTLIAMTNALGAPRAQWKRSGLQLARWQHGDATLEWADRDNVGLILSLSEGQRVTIHIAGHRVEKQADYGLVTMPPRNEAATYRIRGNADIVCVIIPARSLDADTTLFLAEDPALSRCIMQTYACLTAGDDGPLMIDDLCQTLRLAVGRVQGTHRSAGGLSSAQLRRVFALIDEAADQERSISLEQLAAAAHTSLFHFAHEFRRVVGVSPYAFTLQRRVVRARRLLLQTNDAVGEVGFRCGFASAANFVFRFHKMVGVTPGRYRELMLRQEARFSISPTSQGG